MPDQPQQLGAPAKDPVIYTIPDQFYGLAAKAQLPREVAPVSAAAGLPGAVVPPAPPVPKKKGSKKWLLIPIFAVLFLALLSVAAWWFLRPQAPAPAPTPSVTLPTPQPQPEPTPEPQPAPATATPETLAPVVLDTDNDGLTDVEESLYTTNPNSADSDGDGYSDSLEVINLYNPAGFKPTKLIEAGLVKTYDGAGFQLLYPSSWTVRPGQDSSFPGSVEFVSAEGSVVQVAPYDNAANQSILDWYLSRNPDSVGIASTAQSFFTKAGLGGMRFLSTQGYVSAGGKIYQLTLIGSAAEDTTEKMLYRSTFTMMINSFSQKP